MKKVRGASYPFILVGFLKGKQIAPASTSLFYFTISFVTISLALEKVTSSRIKKTRDISSDKEKEMNAH